MKPESGQVNSLTRFFITIKTMAMTDQLELQDLFPEWNYEFIKDVQDALERMQAIEAGLKAKYPGWMGFSMAGVDLSPLKLN